MKTTFIKFMFVGILITTVNISCSNSVPNPDTSTSLDVNQSAVLGKWQLKSLDNKYGINLNNDFPQGLPFLDFTAKDHLSAFDGCNTIHGAVDISKNEMSFGNLASTMMACMNVKDANFSSKLKGKVQYKVVGNELTVLQNNKEVMKFNRAASIDGTWVLEEFIGKDRSMKSLDQRFPNKKPTITFDNGKVSGTNGCNNLTGAYTAKSNVISMGNIASTRMACEGVDGSFDERFSKVNSFAINNNKLTLFVDGVKTMVFGNLKQPR